MYMKKSAGSRFRLPNQFFHSANEAEKTKSDNLVLVYKIYESKYGLMVAVADKELIGKTLKYKNLEVFVNPRFYKGEEADQHEVIELLKKSTSTNLIGKEAVACGVQAGLIDKKNIIMIGKVPHAHAFVMSI